MKSRIKKRALGIIALAVILVISLVLALYSAAVFSPVTFSADDVSAVIQGDGSAGVDVYISGDGVTRDENGKYSIPQNTDVEITVVNNTTVSNSLKVTDENGNELLPLGTSSASGTSSANFIKVNSGNTSSLNIEVSASLSTERGKSLSYAYEISSQDELLALSKILASTDSDVPVNAEIFANHLALFGLEEEGWFDEDGNYVNTDTFAVSTAVSSARDSLSSAYFVLTDDIMLNAGTDESQEASFESGYFGIGSRRSGTPFAGVFDFNGHAVTMNMVISEASASNFSSAYGSQSNQKILSVGFFNFIQGDGINACAIIGADVRGTMAISAEIKDISSPDNDDYRLYAGGVAGTIGDKVVLDGVTSSASLTVTASHSQQDQGISVYAGGVFGFSSADINYWSDVSYNGNYSEVSVTNSSNKTANDTIVGGLAGVIQNAYVNGFTANLRGANILADSVNRGSALAGGLAGVAYVTDNISNAEALSQACDVSIENIDISAADSTISAIAAAKGGSVAVNPDKIIENRAFGVAIAGGMLGTAHASSSNTSGGLSIYITGITFNSVQGAAGGLDVRSGLSGSDSVGASFAGGVFGYVMQGELGKITYTPHLDSVSGGKTIFHCDVAVNSSQSGTGPVYAGGIFGYNAFSFTDDAQRITFNLLAEGKSIEVSAEQTETAGINASKTLYDVSAGFFASKLQAGYSLKNFTFNVGQGTVTASRAVGSVAVGDISAGAIAGKAEGSGNADAVIEGVTVNLTKSSVNALGYSFDSNYGQNIQGNNVYAGGVLGYAKNYNNGTACLKNISVNYSGRPSNGYAVRGIQNAVTGNGDYCTEGYAGGMFGMLEGCSASGLTVNGSSPAETLVYLNATNDPNTACIGGLIGATRLLDNQSIPYSLTDCTVKGVHVAGRAYYGSVQSGDTYDLYTGGAVGVFGTARNEVYNVTATNITVEDCNIESVGEEFMLTYAGGVFGGVWYKNSIHVENCISRNNNVLASSASYNTYSGGIVGLIQSNTTYLKTAYVLDTTVKAITYSSSRTAYAAGISPKIYNSSYVANCVSNASVSAEGVKTNVAGIGICANGNSPNNSNNYFIAANVKAGAITAAKAFNDDSGSDNYAIALIGSNANNVQPSASNELSFESGRHGKLYSSSSNIRYNDKENDDNSVDGESYNDGYIKFRVKIVGDSVILDEAGDDLYVEQNGNNTGTSYAQLFVKTGTDYELLCSYPVTVTPASSAEKLTVTTPDNNDEEVNDGNSHNYTTASSSAETYNVYQTAKLNDITQGVGNWTIDNFITIPNNIRGIVEKIEVSIDVSFSSNPTWGGDLSLGSTTIEDINSGQTCEFIIYNPTAESYSLNWDHGYSTRSMYLTNIKVEYTIEKTGDINYTYFQIYAGEDPAAQGGKLQNVLLSTTNVYSPSVYMAENNLIGFIGDGNVAEGNIKALINGAMAANLSDALEYFNITQSPNGNSIALSPVLGKTDGAALILQYDLSDGTREIIVIEVVPNAITGITVKPAADTPARAVVNDDNDNTVYYYSPGDKVRLEAELEQRFEYNLLIVDVKYSGGSGVAGNDITVRTNGTIEIGTEARGTFTVICTSIADKGKTGSITINVVKNIDVVPRNMQGTVFTPAANNNAVEWQPYTFYLDPNPGYGLNPTVTLSVNKTDGTSVEHILNFKEEHTGITDGTVPFDGYMASYVYDELTGMYTVTLPKELFGENVDYIAVDAEFTKVYSIMFDLGEGASFTQDGGSRYFIYQVKNGKTINSTLLDEINTAFCSEFGLGVTGNAIYEQANKTRSGFVFKGFYPTNSASSERAYGTEFLSRIESGSDQVRGAMNYYARWNYTVDLYAPAGITIKSALNAALVSMEPTAGGIIPIDTEHGFSFTVSQNYVGIPRVKVYSGSVELQLTQAKQVDGTIVYTVADPLQITDRLIVYIYGDNISLAAGETDEADSFGGALALREDGIFTVRYVINHSQGATALGKGVEFTFSQSLPAGTAVRLFYQVNGSPVSVGEYVPKSAVDLFGGDNFTALTGSPNMFEYSGNVVSEVYYLVITLPNNKNNFSSDKLTVSVEMQPTTGTTPVNYYTAPVTGEAQQTYAEPVRQQNGVISAEVTLYDAVIRSGQWNGTTLTYEAKDTATNAPADIRHQDKFYVWRITGTNITVSGTNVEKVDTDTATYVIIGNAQVKILTVTVGGATSIELLEVANPQYPAAGTVIWSN